MNPRVFCGAVTIAFALLILLLPSFVLACVEEENKERSFEFTYEGTLSDLPVGATVRMWIPLPNSGQFQELRLVEFDLPAAARTTREKKYGNRMLHLNWVQPNDKPIHWKLKFQVVRREKTSGGTPVPTQPPKPQFLQANGKVPVAGKPVRLFDQFLEENRNELGQVAVERQIYEFVAHHMAYDKSKPGFGEGDVSWACDSRTGNCTDFHSLFISIARNRKIPARFQIGFPIPPARGEGEIKGYHCWAEFFLPKRGWAPVDISEADKNPQKKDYFFGAVDANRVQFTTGRDLILEPKQNGPPLNYFIYPYVELDGKPASKKQFVLRFHYRDIRFHCRDIK